MLSLIEAQRRINQLSHNKITSAFLTVYEAYIRLSNHPNYNNTIAWTGILYVLLSELGVKDLKLQIYPSDIDTTQIETFISINKRVYSISLYNEPVFDSTGLQTTNEYNIAKGNRTPSTFMEVMLTKYSIPSYLDIVTQKKMWKVLEQCTKSLGLNYSEQDIRTRYRYHMWESL